MCKRAAGFVFYMQCLCFSCWYLYWSLLGCRVLAVLWFVSYVIGKAYSPSAQLGLSYLFLVLGNQPLLWGKEANLKLFASEYNTQQHSVAQHWIGVSVCVHMKKCASLWTCIRLSFSHFCDLLKSLTVPLGLRVCVPWQWKHITERQIHLAWECQQDFG